MKENNLFELVHIQELPSQFNREIALDKEILKESQLAYLVVFQHQADNETVGLHVSIRYITTDNRAIMQEGATFVAKIDGWLDMPHDEKSLRADCRVQSLISYGLSFVSGMIFRRASGSVMNNIFVPHMSVASIIDNVVIEEVKKKNGK